MIKDSSMFSSLELTNLDTGITALQKDISIDNTLFSRLMNHPYSLMRQYHIIILEDFSYKSELVDSFNRSARELLTMQPLNNRCMSCKLTVLAISSALVSKFGIQWLTGHAALTAFQQTLKNIFTGMNPAAERFIHSLISGAEKKESSELVAELCRLLGHCVTATPE